MIINRVVILHPRHELKPYTKWSNFIYTTGNFRGAYIPFRPTLNAQGREILRWIEVETLARSAKKARATAEVSCARAGNEK